MKRAQTQVAEMSVEEKIRMLSGSGFSLETTTALPPANLKKDVSGIAGYINGIRNNQLDIPAIALADGPAGVRIVPDSADTTAHYNTTAWPIGSLLASTWNNELITLIGSAFGREVRDLGIDFILAPGLNIQRNPLNGRNFEYYSEDPLVAGRSAAAMVRGIQANGVGATIKHFVANNSETNRMQVNELISPRSLREIYLRGFQIAVAEGKPWAIMTSYNKVNGVYTNARSDLLLAILRGEWGFEGLVMSDWFAGDLDHPEQQIIAGNDLIEPGGEEIYQRLLSAYESGLLSEDIIDGCVTRIIYQISHTPAYLAKSYAGAVRFKEEHLELSRYAAAEGMVLLRNCDALPVIEGQTLAVFGINQVNTFKGGTGSGDVNVTHSANIAEGLAARFDCNQELLRFYTDYFAANKTSANNQFGGVSGDRCDEPAIDANAMKQYASDNDMAVICIGRQAGEGADRNVTEGDYLLSAEENTLLEQVSEAFHQQHKKVVVVLNINGVIDTGWSNEVDAILLAYMPGQDGSYAIADLLSGDENPSGKLAQTFPLSYQDVPSANSFPGFASHGNEEIDTEYYNEDIYVGYRYYTTFNRPVAYPFGYGLSYSCFRISDARITSDTLALGRHGHLTFAATVTNTGSMAGKEVAQLYVHAPQGKLAKPAIELKSFAKTKRLEPGESQKLDFQVPAELLASFDPQQELWLIEEGSYQFYISNSSELNETQPLTVEVPKTIKLMKTSPDALSLPEGISEDTIVTIRQ